MRDVEPEIKMPARLSQPELASAQLAEFAATLDQTQAIIHKLDGTILYWSTGAELLYGWSREEAMGRKSHELLKSEFSRPIAELEAELMEHGSWRGEFRQRCRDGSAIWVAGYWAVHRNAEGIPVSVVKVNNDITALKTATEALRATEATARSLFENASQGILTIDRDGLIVDANTVVQGIFGYSHAELIGATLEMLVPDLRGWPARHDDTSPAQTGSLPPSAIPRMELLGHRREGSVFPAEVSLSCVEEHSSGGMTLAFISDITARNQANRIREDLIVKLEAALSEKTVLLKEVHHRVKNNLAVIAGLLGMQADALADEQARTALSESQQRVLSMALIHEYLYASEHLDRVNFGAYVRQLANELCVSYAIASDLVGIRIDAEEVQLPVHRAIPCGLILNELLSNALKYGFPNGRSGEITVHFGELGPGRLSLACRDDGIDIPENVDWQNPQTLGLRIVAILAKQIDGQLTLDRGGGGTRFELKFPAHARVNP